MGILRSNPLYHLSKQRASIVEFVWYFPHQQDHSKPHEVIVLFTIQQLKRVFDHGSIEIDDIHGCTRISAT